MYQPHRATHNPIHPPTPGAYSFTVYKDPLSVLGAIVLGDSHLHFTDEEGGPWSPGRSEVVSCLQVWTFAHGPQMMFPAEVMSSLSLQVCGREVVEGTWASCGILQGSPKS